MKTSKSVLFLALVNLIVSAVSYADTGSSSSQTVDVSNRSEKKLGAYIGILGDPHPTVLGFNIAYNALDYMRLSAGYGKLSASTISINNSGVGTVDSSMTTLGVAARFFMPGWNLTPTAGIGYSHVSVSDNLSFASDYKANNIYLSVGGDWQASNGFNLGAGVNVSVNGAAPTAPYINLGYFFM